MKRVICSPGSYLQGQGELSRLAEYYHVSTDYLLGLTERKK